MNDICGGVLFGCLLLLNGGGPGFLYRPWNTYFLHGGCHGVHSCKVDFAVALGRSYGQGSPDYSEDGFIDGADTWFIYA